jgi:hypothetical protein
MLTLPRPSYRESLDNITVVIVRFISDGTMETSNEGAERAEDEETDEMTVLVDEGGVVPKEDDEGLSLDVDNEVIIREVSPSPESSVAVDPTSTAAAEGS